MICFRLALNFLTDGSGIQNLNRFVLGGSSGRAPDLTRSCARSLSEVSLATPG
jgi:hypothetical protein